MIRYYVRVSSVAQKVDRQLIAYDKADFIYIDKMTRASRERPELQRMLNELQPNDFVVVKSLDILSRSTRDTLELVDTNTPLGEFFMTVVAALAQLERQTIRERTLEGIAIAKAEGKFVGRKKGSIALKGNALKRFIYFYKLGMNKNKLSQEFGVPRSTIYRWIATLKERKLIK